jgi:hypothetical protein
MMYLELREAHELSGRRPPKEPRILCIVPEGHPSFIVQVRQWKNGRYVTGPNKIGFKGWHPSWSN